MSTKIAAGQRLDTKSVFDRYHKGWEARDPGLIASLHSADTVFHIHDGSEPITGRQLLKAQCAGLFEQFKFSIEKIRLLCGDDFWTFEWLMVMELNDCKGVLFTAKVEMLDVVTLNHAREVLRKDVYMNGAQRTGAFTRAGIEAKPMSRPLT
ncbi:nuclear transport factor 2 family protein [Microbulbifer spongiae]|uniref:Nuclear transport factor 2 family protein n=1 Tax=Microbulbifer spongiae TaxID=2944933 RepID=A0ABY9EDR3_9GAMM|nr:nuclear transport factor 2 family protein [Microbulbifer sp. MI-G]WKD49664.1 nuclear transport factor 2 family protein [Microbulbifer sp. MI-G]